MLLLDRLLTALPLAAAHVQDSVTAQGQPVSAIDSTVVDSPLPGGVAEVVRFLLNGVPSWMQLGGLFLGTVAAVFLLRFLVIRRAAILGWVLSRERPVKAGLVALVVVLVGSAAAMGAATWNYTQHDNDFCTGCHVMNPAFQRYVALGAKHDTLSCHDCHQQSTFASMRQLYLWVAERPERIGPHAKVKNQVCEGCHATADTAKWQRIKTTAGHRVHLESDSSALKDVQCVQCHGVEIHRFRPADATCGQSGCHSKASTHIVLGKMSDQTILHCTGCHGFTDDVALLATRDSAAGVLRPGSQQCLGCHEMQMTLPDFSPRLEPHGGKCGTCHNPHTDSLPSAAKNSCAASGCHANFLENPFHAGPNHRRLARDCTTCHVPHVIKVDPSDCQGCHLRVRQRNGLRPPVQFDTTAALRRTPPP